MRYNVEVKDLSQPLLMHFDVAREQVVHLVPELCVFVGVTDQIRDDRKVWREIKLARRTDAPVKIKEATSLIASIMTNARCISKMQSWRFYFHQQVLGLQGKKYEAGNILMGIQNKADDSSAFNKAAREGECVERIKFCIEEHGRDLVIPLTRNKLFD